MTNQHISYSIDLEWLRDDAGYQLLPAAPAPDDAPRHLLDLLPLSSGGNPALHDRIVRRGGKLVPYRPFQVTSGLYRIFVGCCVSIEGILDFYTRFGPLTAAGNAPDMGDDLLFIRSNADTLGELLLCSPDERISRVARFSNGLKWSRIDMELAINPATGKPQFRYGPPSLHNALWLEFGQVLTSGATMRVCEHCGTWFEAGPGTGRREDAKFCSDEHRIVFNSRKRGKGR